MVHASVLPEWRQHYYQVLYRWAHIIAVCLADLEEPAHVPAMEIKTFGQPVAQPAMRYSTGHRAFILQEVRDARAAGLIF